MAQGAATGWVFGKVRKRFVGLSKWVTRAAGALAVAGAVGFGWFTWLSPSGPTPGPILLGGLASMCALLVAPFLGLVGKVLAVGGLRREGWLRADRGALYLRQGDGRERVVGFRVESGVIVPGEGYFEVELILSDGNHVSVRVQDEASAEALLDLAGVGSERRITRVRWARLFSRLLAGSIGSFVGFAAGIAALLSVSDIDPLGSIALLMTFVLPFLLPAPLSRLLAWRELEVGADAVAWRYYFRKKLVPLAKVRSVHVEDGELFLRLEDGTDRRFEIPRAGLAEGLRRRIDKALAAMGAADAKGSLFQRGELSFSAWMDRVRGLLQQEGAFRTAPVAIEDAVRVLEDPDAEPDVRVGAALALHATKDEALKQRVRVVAENCVSPKLRVALEDTAEGRELHEEVVEAARGELRLAR